MSAAGERDVLMDVLLSAGMDPEEAEHFLQKGNIIVNKVLQLDGREAARVIPELAKLGLIQGAVNIRIGIEKSRQENFVAKLEELTGQKVIEQVDFSGETTKRTEPLDLKGLDDPNLTEH